MSSGSLGRAVIDLDAELAALRSKLREGGEADRLVRDWAQSAERLRPTLDVDLEHAAREVERFTASLGTARPLIVDADTDAAVAELREVERAAEMLTDEERLLRIRADIDQAEAELREVRAELDKLPDAPKVVQVRADIDQATKELGGLRRVLDEIGTMAAGFTLANAIEEGTRQLVAFGRESFKAASAAAENLARVDEVFGESARTIRAWAETTTESLGISESASLGAAGEFGNLLTAMGFTQGAAAEMSQSIVTLAADLASFNNIGVPETLEKIRAGLIGEAEPLRSLGVNLSAAAVQSRALEMGLADTAAALTAADKAQASYALILEQTRTAQGDFARNADGAANSIKSAEAAVEDLQVALGELATPAVADFAQELASNVRTLTGWIEKVREADAAAGDFAQRLTGIEIDAGPLEGWFDVVRSGGPAIYGAGKYWDFLSGKLDEAQVELGLAEAATDGSTSALAAWVDRVVDAHREGGIFAGVIQEIRRQQDDLAAANERLFASGAQDYATDLERLARNGRAAQLAQNEHTQAVEEANDAIRRGYGGLTAFASGSEMVADSVERANQRLALMGEASRLAIEGQENLNQQWTDANETVGFWESSLSNAEAALAILDGELTEHGSLTEEQQQDYDTLTQAVGRYTGGIEDSEGAVVDAAVAQAEYIAKQDELNGLLAAGKIEPAEYARAMADLNAETDPAAAKQYDLSAAMQTAADTFDTTITKAALLQYHLGELTAEEFELIVGASVEEAEQQIAGVEEDAGELSETTATPTVDADTEPFDTKRDGVHSDIGTMSGLVGTPSLTADDSGFVGPMDEAQRRIDALDGYVMTISAQVDLSAAYIALDELRGMTFTQSPPREGPMAGFTPDWSYLFVGLPKDAEDYGEQAMQRLRTHLAGIDLDTILADQIDLNRQIANLEAIRAGLAQSGDSAGVEAISAEIARLVAEAASLAALIETDAVQAWLANQNAAEQATEAAEEALDRQRELAEEARRASEAWAATIGALGDVGGLDRLEERFRNAQLALDVALSTPGMDPVIVAALQEQFAAAVVALDQYQDAYRVALERGLFTQEELLEQARAGGETLRLILEAGVLSPEDAAALASEGGDVLRQILASGLLSPEQIDALVAGADEATRAILAAFFGEEAIAAIEDRLDDIEATTYEALLAMRPPDGAPLGEGWVASIVEGLLAGRLSLQQAMELLGDDLSALAEEDALALLDTYDQLWADLARARATGEGLAEAEAAYAEFMALLTQIAIAAGMTADEVVSMWRQMEAAAGQTAATLSGTSFGVGGPAGGADLGAALSDLAGFTTSLDELERIIDHLAGGNLTTTLADDTLQYLAGIFEDAPRGLVDHVLAGLGDQLDLLGLGPEDQLATLNAELRALGLREVTPEQWAEWNRSEVDAIDGLGSRLTNHWTQQTDRLLGALGVDVATGAGIGVAGRAVATPQAVSPAAAGTVVIHNEIGGRAVEELIVDTVTGAARRELR